MQGLRLKLGERASDWKCCICCHVRTGTIFIGIWYLMLHALILSMIAVFMSQPKLFGESLDPILPTPLSEVDQVNSDMYGEDLDWTVNNDGASIKPLALLPNTYNEILERENITQQDLNIGIVVTVCSFAMTLMLVYGAIKGKPSYLMPFFCLKVFDFCVAGISAVGYFCYPPDLSQYWVKKFSSIPVKGELLDIDASTIITVTVVCFILILIAKAYFISIIWRCYKYLCFRQVAAQRTMHFLDPVSQNLLPDLPDYETAVKKFPTPPPSYASAVQNQAPAGNTTSNQANASQPLPAQNDIVRAKTPENQDAVQGNKPENM